MNNPPGQFPGAYPGANGPYGPGAMAMDPRYRNMAGMGWSGIPTQKPDRLTGTYFWLLAMICLWNLNGFLYLAFEINRLVSIIILALGFLIIGRTMNLWNKCLGPAGRWHIAFLMLYLLIGATVNFELDQLISHINSIFLVFVSALVAADFARRNQTPYFLTGLAIFAVLGAYTVYLSPFLGGLYANFAKLDRVSNVGRWMGFFANPNETGMAAVNAFAVCLAVWMLPPGTSRLKKYLPIIVVFLAIGVVLTFSRSAILAFAFLGIGFAMFSLRLGSRAIGTLIVGLVVFLAAYWFFTSGYKQYQWTPEQTNRIRSIEKMLKFEETSDKDTGGRWNGIIGGLHYWQQSPFFGHGLGSLHKMPDRYFGGLGCHNTHVMVIGEVGILGAWAYFVSLAVFFGVSLKIRDPAVKTYCLLLFFAFLLAGMVDHGVLDTRSFNLLIGSAFGLQSVYATQRVPARYRMPVGYPPPLQRMA